MQPNHPLNADAPGSVTPHHELDPVAKLNWHDPYAYLKDVLAKLPTHPASRFGELLPHRWVPAATIA